MTRNPPRLPSLYQKVLRTAGPELLDKLEGATVVIADEVARTFFADGNRQWGLSDYPTIMPPFAKFFVEWNLATASGTTLANGVLFSSAPIDPREEAEAIDKSQPNLLAMSGCTMVEATIFAHIRSDPRSFGSILFVVDKAGKVKHLGKDGANFIVTEDPHVKKIFEGSVPERFDNFMGTILSAGLLATCFMHSRSVRMTTETTKPSEVRRRLLKPGQRPEKGIRYHVLEIEPMKRILKSEGRSGEIGLKRALHRVRGHFKTYGDKGMFGRDDMRGTFWFEEHDSGDPSRGTVVKDYSIKLPPPEDPLTRNPHDDEALERRSRRGDAVARERLLQRRAAAAAGDYGAMRAFEEDLVRSGEFSAWLARRDTDGTPVEAWQQIDGDVNPAEHGGVIANHAYGSVRIVEIHPITDLIGRMGVVRHRCSYWARSTHVLDDDLMLTSRNERLISKFEEDCGRDQDLLRIFFEGNALVRATLLRQAEGMESQADGPGMGWSKAMLPIDADEIRWWRSGAGSAFRKEDLKIRDLLLEAGIEPLDYPWDDPRPDDSSNDDLDDDLDDDLEDDDESDS